MTDQGDVVEISYVPDDNDDNIEASEDQEVEDKKAKKSSSKKKVSSATKKLQKKLKEQEELVEKLTKERDDFKDQYLRSLAEVDNFRKRIKKEKEEFQKYVLGDFLLGLLEVFDNFERALKAKNFTDKKDNTCEDEKSIISGVEMIYKQLLELLKKNNVIEIDSLGKPFDPNIHQALSKEEKEQITEPIILEVYQKGFLYNGKLLRPTLAKVAIPKEETDEEESETGEE